MPLADGLDNQYKCHFGSFPIGLVEVRVLTPSFHSDSALV